MCRKMKNNMKMIYFPSVKKILYSAKKWEDTKGYPIHTYLGKIDISMHKDQRENLQIINK